MPIMKSTDCRFVKIYKDSSLNNSDFLFAANIDYISFFMQYHIGVLPVGTVLWIIEQSVEKYCKAILNKHDNIKYSDNNLSKKPFSHNILSLWNEIKTITKQFSYEKAYEDLILEINTITTDTRYMNYSAFFNLGLIETFTILGCEFRYEILEKKEFMENFFGLPTLFTPRGFLNNYSYEMLFKKLMHMSIEHGISFSGAGIPDTYEWTGVSLSKASSKFCQCGKHKDVEQDCPMCNNIIWQNGLRSPEDLIKLKKYFEI